MFDIYESIKGRQNGLGNLELLGLELNEQDLEGLSQDELELKLDNLGLKLNGLELDELEGLLDIEGLLELDKLIELEKKLFRLTIHVKRPTHGNRFMRLKLHPV